MSADPEPEFDETNEQPVEQPDTEEFIVPLEATAGSSRVEGAYDSSSISVLARTRMRPRPVV